MSANTQASIRDFLRECLVSSNAGDELDDGESLFLSGRLDSLAVTRLVVFLEENFGIDFGREQFDVSLLDSVDQIAEFVDQHGVAAAE